MNSPFSSLLVSNMDIYCFLFYSVFQPSVLASCVRLDNILLRVTIDTLLYIKINNNVKIQEIYFSHLDHSQSMIKTSVEQSYIKS